MGKLSIVFAVLFSIAACSGDSDQRKSNRWVVNFSLSPPGNKSQQVESRSIDKTLWSVAVTLDGQMVVMTPSDDFTEWRSTDMSLDRPNPALTIIWHYDDVLAADYTGSIDASEDGAVITIGRGDYRITGEEFDLDSDGISNLIEIASGFDPTDDQNPVASMIGVSIPYISPGEAPVIDGSYHPVWSKGPDRDWRNLALRIDNLMIDQGADRSDGQTEFNWTGLHDGEYLYLVVYGEHADIATVQSDSFDVWRDDNFSLVIDGDNSKLQSYDGVDDYNWLIPLSDIVKPADPYTDIKVETDENNDVVRNAIGDIAILLAGIRTFVPAAELVDNSNLGADAPNRIAYNERSASNSVDIQFETCLCRTAGQQIYEVKIRLSDVGIEVGRAFGIELQIDDDIQGGDREARYGWFHPSRELDTDADYSWFNPSFTGTAVLLPPVTNDQR